MSWLRLFRAELMRSYLLQRRYLGNTIASIASVVGIFYLLVLGVGYVAGPTAQFGERLDGILIGYVTWSLLLAITTSLASELQDEAKTGTLEQVSLSVFGVMRTFVARMLITVGWNLMVSLAVLLLLLLLTGIRLSFSLELLLPLAALLLAAYGLAFMIGAVTMLLKNVQQLISLLLFIVLFIVVTPFETVESSWASAAHLLPKATGAGLLRLTMAQGVSVLGRSELLIALANGLIYFGLGLWLLRRAYRRIRRLGLLASH